MNILKNRYLYFIVSAICFVISILLLVFSNLNLSIDMTGGIALNYSYTNNIDIEKLKLKLEKDKTDFVYKNKQIVNAVNAYKVTGENIVSVVAGFDTGIDEKTLDTLKADFKGKVLETIKSFDDNAIETNYTNIGKSFGDYIKNTAFLTLGLALIAISVYIYYAFSGAIGGISPVYFGFITLFALFHDVIISSGLYIISGIFFTEFQIDKFFVTALLTILGYSINDTIVVFDRLRGNLKKFVGKKGKQSKTLEEIVNISINETIKRSLYTSLTLIFVLITVFFFGPESLRGFILVMIFGTVIGTYSSIFIAPPLLYELNKKKKLEVYKKKEVSAEDKIVV